MPIELDSPDPLGNSLTREPVSSSVKSLRKPTTPRKTLAESSGNAQIQHFYLTTPRRDSSSSPTKSSAKAQSVISPWRIKVTVEAEPENTMPDSPSKRLDERTTTTRVPLKEAAGSSPPAAKRGRGRPRKSLDGPVKRSGTPKPKAVGRKKATQDVTEDGSHNLTTKISTTHKKARGRPRKSIGSSPTRSEIAFVEKAIPDIASTSSGIEHNTEKSQKNTVPRKRGAPSNSSSTTPNKDKPDFLNSMHHSSRVQQPDSGSRITNGRPAKRRSLDKAEDTEMEPPSERVDDLQTAYQQNEQTDLSMQQSNLAKDDEDMWRSMIRQDSLPLKNTAGIGDTSDQEEDDDDMAAGDPTDEHREFDSILESEGFSMVSVSSLPSAQQHSGSSANREDGSVIANGSISGLTPAQVLPDTNANTCSQMRTPSFASSSSSSMPPPPIPSSRPRESPRPMTKPTDGTPRLGRVVRAGIALQGVLSPSNSTYSTSQASFVSTSSAKSSKDRMDNLFDGFGAGTRRELRAGLRLGEELAKRQQRDQNRETFKERVEDDVFSQGLDHAYPRLPKNVNSDAYALKLPVTEQQIQYPTLQNPQLPSPAGSITADEDRMSWRASSPLTEPVLPTLQQPVSWEEGDSEPYEGQSTPLRAPIRQTPLTVQIQRERAAVSKQIDEANSSQVIVIDSDDETEVSEKEDEDDGDIWQQEANSSRSIPEPSPQVPEALPQQEPPKPRRSKLPNTWRKDRQIIYSDEVDQDEHQDVGQPKNEVVIAVPKDEIAMLQKDQELGRNTLSAPTEDGSFKPAPVRGARKTKVKIDSEFQAVERPGWKKVKGRLLTPAKKTLKNVLAQEYEDMTAEDLNDEDDQMSDTDQGNAEGTAIDPHTYPKLDGASRDEHSVEDPSPEEEDSGRFEKSIEYEEPLKFDREKDTSRTGVILSHTPPGSPPQHFYASIYLPPATDTTSWLSSLTTYIPTIRTPAATPVPGADELDPTVYNLEPYSPIYKCLPWENIHSRILRPYFDIQFAKPGTYPFNPYSPSASLISLAVYARGNYGWVRYLSKSDLGLVDKFMHVLHVKGVERRPGLWGRGDGARINELEVAKKIFEMWEAAVLVGQVEVGEGNGTGKFPGTGAPFDPRYPLRAMKVKKEVCIIP